jgi:hypothetical protein
VALSDNKVISGRISLKQVLGLGSILAFCFLFVYFDALVVGYVIAVAALSAFYLVVAFDIGLPKSRADEAEVPRAYD